jgi:DNA-binding FrmR family transcriptional regulator
MEKPKQAHHSEISKKKMLNRLKRIEGQVRGVSRMIEGDTYCDEVLHQLSSVCSALEGVKRLLLEAHVKTCVVDQIQNGRMAVVDELMTTLKKMG